MNKGILISVLLLGLVLFLSLKREKSSSNKAKADDFRVVAFYKGDGKDIEQYELEKITHLIFCFTYLEGNKIKIKNSEDEAILKHFVSLKTKYPQLKILVSFGGWGGCETCSDIFASAADRTAFAASVKDLLEQFNADGIDLDWESPVIGGYKNHKASADDKANFTALVKELRKTLPTKSQICFDANSFNDFLQLSIDWPAVMPSVDFVNLMTYGLPSNESRHTGHHSALYSSPYQNESADKAINTLDSLGVPLNKIIIGAAFYSFVAETVDTINNGLGRVAKFKANINYSKLVQSYTPKEGFEYHWDSLAQAPFLYNKQLKTFVTFDDKKSVALKTQYAMNKNLGGIMFWKLNGDTYSNGLLDAIDRQIKSSH